MLPKNKTGAAPIPDVVLLGCYKVLGKGKLLKQPGIMKAKFFRRKAEEKIKDVGRGVGRGSLKPCGEFIKCSQVLLFLKMVLFYVCIWLVKQDIWLYFSGFLFFLGQNPNFLPWPSKTLGLYALFPNVSSSSPLPT